MTKTRSIYAILVCLALVAAVAVGVRAQSLVTGQINGSVVDPTGGVVPNARVTVENIATGAMEQPIHTNSSGNFEFPLLKPGSYIVRVSTPNFHTMIAKVEVELGKVESVNFKLEVGEATQTVEISAEAPLIDKENGNLGATVSEVQAQNIPNPGNDLTYTAQITPGTTMNNAGGGYGNFSSFGMSATTNLFTLDGMDDNDPFLNINDSGATNLMLGLNEIQEVTVVGDGYSGQYGTLAGASVNFVTKSGTDSFHGHAIWEWNGGALNANNWFKNVSGTPKPFVNANQYGGDVGGPVKKNKLFFYYDMEGLRLLIPTSSIVYVPSPQFAAAVQSNINGLYGSTSTIAKFYQNIFSLYAGAPGESRAKPNLGDGGCDGSEAEAVPTGGSGSGGDIRAHGTGESTTVENTFDVPGGTVFGTGGAPCALSFFSNVGNKTYENLQAWRIDWNISAHDQLWFRMQHDLGFQASFTDPINKAFNGQSTQPEWQGQIEESHDFSSGAVNQLILAGQWYSAIFSNANLATTLNTFPTTLSFASGQFSNLGGIDYYWPEGRRLTQAQVSDDFVKPNGAQTWKIGLKFRKNYVTNLDYGVLQSGLVEPITLDGFFWGGTDPTAGNGAAIGNESVAEQYFPTSVEQPFSVWSIGGYIEDDWKVKHNLTLTLTFRGDHANIPICPRACFALPSTTFPQLSTSTNMPYDKLISTGLTNMLPSLTVFEPQPRIGFAWTKGNTTVRGGAGLFYDSYSGALLDNYSENPPLDPSFFIGSGTVSSASDPNSLLASAAASNAAFQAAFKTGGTFNSISESLATFTPPGLAGADAHPKVPQYQKWNIQIQQAFGPNTSFSVEYAGNHGIHILDQNQGINACNVTGDFTQLPKCNVGGTGLNANFGSVIYSESIGVASSNGLTASLTHRYKSGSVQINYTYSHTLDDVSNSGEEPFSSTSFGAPNTSVLYPQNPFNPQANYASADQDVRHMLTFNYVWELPIKRFLFMGHGPDWLLNGWDVNGLLILRTGFPFTITDGAKSSELSPNGYGTAVVFGTQLAPGGTGGNCQALGAEFNNFEQPNVGVCLNPNDYDTMGDGGFGNLGRNTIRGPSFWNTDFSIMKHIPIYERAELVIGAQFYNLFNHPNFGAPVTDEGASNFGQVTQTISPPTSIYGSVLGADASPRLIQLKLEADF